MSATCWSPEVSRYAAFMCVRSWETIVRVRGEDVAVLVVEPLAPDKGRDIVFLHGYARHPQDYVRLLEALAETGWRVVAPFLFANNGLRRPPIQFWACAALALRAVEALRKDGLVDADAPIFGHSTGGAVTYAMGRLDPPPSGLLAVNPVQPARGHPLRFVCASAWMNAKMTLGLAGHGREARRVLRESAGRFYGNWLRKPAASYRLIGGLRAFDYDCLQRWYRGRGCSVPLRAVWGHGDEFYPHTRGLEEGLARTFERLEVTRLDGTNSHEWVMFDLPEAQALVEGTFLPGPRG